MYNWNFLDQLFLPYKFHGSDMWGVYFFIFASCEPLNLSTWEISADLELCDWQQGQ